MRWLWLLLVPLLAGCSDDASYSLAGSFTEDRPDDALTEVGELAQEHGGDTVIMESFPEQFRVTGLSQDACQELRDALAQKPYLQSLGQCEARRSTTGY